MRKWNGTPIAPFVDWSNDVTALKLMVQLLCVCHSLRSALHLDVAIVSTQSTPLILEFTGPHWTYSMGLQTHVHRRMVWGFFALVIVKVYHTIPFYSVSQPGLCQSVVRCISAFFSSHKFEIPLQDRQVYLLINVSEGLSIMVQLT